MPTAVTALPLPQPTEHPPTAILVGVDTHKAAHVAVAITALGARVAACSAPADRDGYAALLAWARTLGRVEAFGIEGTGAYRRVRRRPHQLPAPARHPGRRSEPR